MCIPRFRTAGKESATFYFRPFSFKKPYEINLTLCLNSLFHTKKTAFTIQNQRNIPSKATPSTHYSLLTNDLPDVVLWPEGNGRGGVRIERQSSTNCLMMEF